MHEEDRRRPGWIRVRGLGSRANVTGIANVSNALVVRSTVWTGIARHPVVFGKF